MIAGLFGSHGLTAGLLLALAHGFATLTWLQNRLSQALT
jgi:hypothetical protein